MTPVEAEFGVDELAEGGEVVARGEAFVAVELVAIAGLMELAGGGLDQGQGGVERGLAAGALTQDFDLVVDARGDSRGALSMPIRTSG